MENKIKATSPVSNKEEVVAVVTRPTKIESFIDGTPSNWEITPTETGITAYNSKTAERFEGSIEDFNAALRS